MYLANTLKVDQENEKLNEEEPLNRGNKVSKKNKKKNKNQDWEDESEGRFDLFVIIKV
jgi:ATP-binding cassette subfamily F protein 1